MPLDRLTLTNFRTYQDQQFELDPAITLVVGPNASGKTNLLESIYVLASTKSFRAKDRELIHHGADHYRIVAAAGHEQYALAYQFQDGHQTKKASHNDVKRPLSKHVGQIQAVLFEPGDLAMVSGPPEGRRRYLDYILCQTDAEYLTALNQYRRALKQRNSLLSNFDTARIKDEIFAWDVKLTEFASTIYSKRQQLVAYLNQRINGIYASIAGGMVEFELNYLPSVKGQNYSDSFLSALATNLTHDLAAGFTTIGPHREDFDISFRGNDITAVASRGEVRTVVLALKLAELEYSEEQSGRRPLLLLDDVFSELDHQRRRDLLLRLTEHQVVITTTEADAIVPDIGSKYRLIETEAISA